MLVTYVRRELSRRKKQTVIVAIGMAVAVALVVLVSAVSSGIANAQGTVLDAIYGVGTDITVTTAPQAQSGANRQRFQLGQNEGSTNSGGTTSVSTSRLSTQRGLSTMKSSALTTVRRTAGVANATATLDLNLVNFSGNFQAPSGSEQGGSTARPDAGAQSQSGSPDGGPGGFRGGNFDVDQTTVVGIDPSATDVGPLSGVKASSGRTLKSGEKAAVVSDTYAKDKSLKVGSTVTIAGKKVKVVGILATGSQELSDIYLPLDYAQTLAGDKAKITRIYVQADSATSVEAAATALGKALPKATVSTQSDLASTISGSLASASTWISTFGRWLTVGVLALALVLAALFTVSGISRRTRELGTLKAIGWSGGRVVREVFAETLAQAAIGGIAGLLIGVGAVFAVNAAHVSLDASGQTTTRFAAPAGAFGGGGGESGFGQGAPGGEGSQQGAPGGSQTGGTAAGSSSSSDQTIQTTLTAQVSPAALGLGFGAALVGGAVAGLAGAARSTRLRPAAALRAIE